MKIEIIITLDKFMFRNSVDYMKGDIIYVNIEETKKMVSGYVVGNPSEDIFDYIPMEYARLL